MPRRQTGQAALAIDADLEPVLLVVTQPETVALAVAADMGQQPGGDQQFTVIRLQRDQAIKQGAGLQPGRIGHPHIQCCNLQLRGWQRLRRLIQIEMDQTTAVQGQATPRIAAGRMVKELGFGQTITDPEHLHLALAGPAHQPARGGGPDLATIGQQQPPQADRRDALGRTDMLLQLQPVACLAIAPDHAFTGQPDQVRIGKDNVIHRQVRRQATDGDQLVVMPALYPTLAGDPQAAIRSRPQLVDQLVEQAFRPAWLQLPEQPAVDAALLQADAMDLHPDAAIGHQGHQIHPLERVIAGNDAFAAQAAAVPLIPEQLTPATEQDPPIRQHQHRPQGLVIDLLAAEQAAELSLAIEPEQAGVTADQKAIAIGRTAGQADAFQQLALELMHIAKTPPIRRQVGQSLAVGGKPQPALVVLEHVHHRAVGHPQPGQRTALELLHPAIALQVQTGGGAQPVRPVVVLEHGG